MTAIARNVAGRETGAQHPFSPSVHCARKGSPCASTRPSRSRSASPLLVALVALLAGVSSAACGREVTPPEQACGWIPPTTGIIRNAAGDSVSVVTIKGRYVCR